MLRKKFKEKIWNVLSSNPFFSLYDFKVNESNGVVKIEYDIDPKYFFSFEIPDSKKYVSSEYGEKVSRYIFKAEISPWESAIEETTTFEGQGYCLDGISKWLVFLREDLCSTPALRRINDIESQVSEFSKKADLFGGEYLTVEESDKLKISIEELSKKLEDAIASLSIHEAEKTEKIDTLKAEVESLKSKIDILDKKGVFKSILGSFMQWGSKPENQALMKGAGDMAMDFIENNQAQ